MQSAFSSTTSPREKLIRNEVGFIRRSFASLTNPRVSGVSGVWRETTSACPKTSSIRARIETPNRSAVSGRM